MENKKCIKCQEESDDFKNGNICNNCIKIYKKEYYLKNKEKITNKSKNYYLINKDNKLTYQKKYNYLNKNKINEKRKKYFNEKRKNGIFRLKNNIRTLIKNSINRNGFNKNTKTNIILGCIYEEFIYHIESKFEEWMTWDNYGLYNGELNHGWDIDHIIPISSSKTKEEVLKLNHFSNLQPLCSKINRDIKRNSLL